MQPMIGRATITSDGGAVYEGDADVRFTETRGMKSGRGTFDCDNPYALMMENADLTLECSGMKIGIIVKRVTHDQPAEIITTGAPY